MASARHKKSVPANERARKIAVPAAAALVVLTGISVITASVNSSGTPAAAPAGTSATLSPEPRDTTFGVSRSGARQLPDPVKPTALSTPPPVDIADLDLSTVWLTEDLNVWSGPGEDTRLLAVLDEGRKIQATGRATEDWAQVVYAGELVWVNALYLADEKPVEEEPEEEETETTAEGISGATCPDGSDIEGGLASNAVTVYRAVCAAFPEVSSWGGLRPGDDGDHGTGHALDIMVYENSTLGQSIADYVQANYSELGVSEILWSQQIWTVQRASEGWRPLEDRGSVTANHYDHVHVSVY